MRVISGTLGGRRFNPPNNLPTRPTTDFAKTGLFNIINNHFDFTGLSFLDLFGGTGSISYEFASRGCKRIVTVEKDNRAARFIEKMISDWKIDCIELNKEDVFRYLEYSHEKFDVIFAGPPYALASIDSIPDKIFSKDMLNAGGWLIVETDPKHNFSEHTGFFRRTHYGQTNFHFFHRKD